MKIQKYRTAALTILRRITSPSIALAITMALGSAMASSNAEEIDNLPGMAAQPAEYFYTGKPYDADSGSYTFRYRNYDPEINRWTTADPSGFPDGVNNQNYAPNPFSEFDWMGLATQTLLYSGQYTDEKNQNQELFLSYQISYGWGQQATATLSASVTNPGATFSQQFSNYSGHTITANNWNDLGSPSTTRNSGKAPGEVTVGDLYIPEGWSFDGWAGSPIINPTATIFGPVIIGSSPDSPHLRVLYSMEQTTYSMTYKVVE